jgi:hypothetical protein
MKKFLGSIFHGSLPKNWVWEIQLLAFVRNFSDGITFFECNINWDRFEDDHSPSFQFELTVFNIYNHIWFYQNNYEKSND